MKSVDMDEAKRNLCGLVREVREGTQSEIVICESGRPAAKLVRIEGEPRRQLGVDRGLIRIAPDCDAVNPEIAALFDGP